MMLRSSSTPVLGSLPSSISPENPNHHHHDTTQHPYKSSQIHKLSFHRTPTSGSQHFTTLSCNSSPVTPSVGNGGLRRAKSEGNMESLTSTGDGGGNDDNALSIVNQPKKLSRRLHCSLLETIPFFSYNNSRFKTDGDEYSSDDGEEHEEDDCGFRSVNMENKVLMLNKQMGFENLERKDDIGIDAGFDHGDSGPAGSDGGRNLHRIGGGGNHDVEGGFRKMMVNESPGNFLLLENYAQFLYKMIWQLNEDLQGAEEYYSMAFLIDPNDGEILSQYANLLWELHRDKERASSYFERAIQAASEDSHVHAAYASFLWETEEDNEEGCYSN